MDEARLHVSSQATDTVAGERSAVYNRSSVVSMHTKALHQFVLEAELDEPSMPLNHDPQVCELPVFGLADSGLSSFSISMTRSWNAFCTFSLCFADASMNAQPSSRASCCPSSVLTTRCTFKSLLLPTMHMGTLSTPEYDSILSRIMGTMSKDAREAIE